MKCPKCGSQMDFWEKFVPETIDLHRHRITGYKCKNCYYKVAKKEIFGTGRLTRKVKKIHKEL